MNAAERRVPDLVSVVIPVRNCLGTLDNQLEALAAQTYPRPFEVIIADNGSTDGLREHLDGHPLTDRLRLRCVDASARVGASHARNTGIAAARGDFIALCDGDDRVYPDWLTAMTAAAQRCALVSGAVETHSLNSVEVQAWRPMQPAETPYEFPGFLPFAISCNAGFWRDVFDRVGGYDEEYDRGAEDVDFSFRVQLAGGVHAHVPESLVAYRLRDTRRGVWDQALVYGTGDARIYSDYRQYGMSRMPWYLAVDQALYLLLRNPMVPVKWTGIPAGEWLFRMGNIIGRAKGSLRYRCFYL
ncbi:glycosyltransferase [Gordonia sp. CPCC 205515]|uniref:glycosyltransferase family 2 protein n=1 Tax=Gordonia sp. CPCC 205515 TaxID=3140791 RepID=UPI003AF38D2D